jgi:hypothetical protein
MYARVTLINGAIVVIYIGNTILFHNSEIIKLRQSSRIVQFHICSNQDNPEKRKDKNIKWYLYNCIMLTWMMKT